ncbi:hypothetical protein AX13_09810 [Comamonas aquatica DA1877]|uniref:Uncharacterized protein n=1 Tax=Comamonas aquatica DA1877 TaxID=1457173 RepID=A0A014NY38_9BURK|nr:hypothetical protein AX13_09810 [Comamonas aquatica DA1877]
MFLLFYWDSSPDWLAAVLAMQMAYQACINQFVQAPDHGANFWAGSSQPPNFSRYLVADPPLFDGNAVKNLLGNRTLAGEFLALFLWCHLLSPVGTGVPPLQNLRTQKLWEPVGFRRERQKV